MSEKNPVTGKLDLSEYSPEEIAHRMLETPPERKEAKERRQHDKRQEEASTTIKATSGYRALRTEIESLLEDDDYSEDYRPPSLTAVQRSQEFLDRTLREMRDEFPVADPIPDGDGGLRLYWMKPGRNLQLNIPAAPEETISIFWRNGLEHALDRDSSPADLAARLAWFDSD